MASSLFLTCLYDGDRANSSLSCNLATTEKATDMGTLLPSNRFTQGTIESLTGVGVKFW